MEARVAIEYAGEPARLTFTREQLSKTIEEAGGSVVDANDANAIMWLSIGDTAPLRAILDTNKDVQWVQLPWAGVESYLGSNLFDYPQTFTCAKGAYGPEVGEHAFMLMLAIVRKAVEQARADGWFEVQPRLLRAKRVTVLGGGDITSNLLRYLKAAETEVTVLRKSPKELEGVRTLQIDRLHAELPNTDVVVLALPLTPDSTGIIGEREIAMLPQGAIIVNVARGKHIDTDALVSALESGHLGGAGLDVTEPEPLPDGHPLWKMNNVLITSHCANSDDFSSEALSERIGDNVRRFIAGEPLVGIVDPQAKY